MPDVVAGPITPSAGPWIFNYATGTATYQISRIAAIEAESDSGTHREVSSNTTRESLTLEQVNSQINVTVFVDTFAITTQGSIGPVQTVQLPVTLRAMFAGDSISPSPEQRDEKCNPVTSAVERDLKNLLITFPESLRHGIRWRDSISTPGCQGAIQTISRTTRSYLVVGEVTYDGLKVLLIQRSDTLSAHGAGAQQQHQLTFDGNGTGKASYYLNTRTGHVLRLTTRQDLSLSITTSGRVHHFKENSTQDFRLVR